MAKTIIFYFRINYINTNYYYYYIQIINTYLSTTKMAKQVISEWIILINLSTKKMAKQVSIGIR